MRSGLLILVLLVVFSAWRDWSQREIVHPPGLLVERQPMQTNLAPSVAFPFKDFQLIKRARFEIRARVLSTEPYWWGTEAKLSPVDLALGWGSMSDQAVLDRINVTQGNRWYYTSYQTPAPVPVGAIILQSGNMHIIPQEKWIEKEVKSLRRGDIVNLRGYLVDIRHQSGFQWNTSLTRQDTGNGSCEILFVEFVQREKRT